MGEKIKINKDLEEAFRTLSDVKMPLTIDDVKSLYKDGKMQVQMSIEDFDSCLKESANNRFFSTTDNVFFITMDGLKPSIEYANKKVTEIDVSKINENQLFRIVRNGISENADSFNQLRHYTSLIDRKVIDPEIFEDWKSEIERYPEEDIDDLLIASDLLTKINSGEITDDNIRNAFFALQSSSYTVKDNLLRMMFRFSKDSQGLRSKVMAVGKQMSCPNYKETIDGIFDEVNPSGQKTITASDFINASVHDTALPGEDELHAARNALNGEKGKDEFGQ